jgi:thiamine pyrophosphokinase
MKNKEIEKFEEIILIGPMMIGELSRELMLANTLHQDSLYIFVDGGARHLDELQPINQLIIGDNDSSEAFDNICAQDFDHLLNKEKDFTDLDYALSLVAGPDSTIHLHGFHAGRPDHQLAVLSSAHAHLKKYEHKVFIHTEYGLYEGFNEQINKISYNGEFSITPLINSNMSIQGLCKYKLTTSHVRPFDSLLLSNIAYGDFVIRSDHAFFVFFIKNSDKVVVND